MDISSKDIFLRYPEISLRYPYDILNRYPPIISFTDIFVYPTLSYDIPLISQSDILHGCHPGGGKRGRFQEKKPSVSVAVAGPWAAAGARPVYKMYARPSCFSAKF